MRVAWKIFEVEGGNVKMLFHGVNGSKTIRRGEVVSADEKMVIDGSGGTEYLSGFHVLLAKSVAEEYIKSFNKRTERLRIMPVFVGDLRKKEHSRSEVYLAKEMMLI